MAFYTDEHGNIVEEKKTFTKPTSTRTSSALSIAKVFGYMFIGLMITGIIAFVLAFIFYNWAKTDSETASQALLITMIIAAISTFILSFDKMLASSTKWVALAWVIITFALVLVIKLVPVAA